MRTLPSRGTWTYNMPLHSGHCDAQADTGVDPRHGSAQG